MTFTDLVQRAKAELPELKSMPKDEFIEWLAASEDMYNAWRYYAEQVVSKNRRRFSAYMIRERVRWYVYVESGIDNDEYKISNNVTPYMARVLAMDLPQLKDVFLIKGAVS